MNQNETADNEAKEVRPRDPATSGEEAPETAQDAAPEPSLEAAEGGEEAAPTKREGSLSRTVVIVLVVVLVLAAAVAGAALGPRLNPQPPDPRVAALGQRVATLESKLAGVAGLGSRLDAIEAKLKGLSDVGSRLGVLEADAAKTADLAKRVNAAETAVAALATRVDGTLDKRLKALDERVARLESGAAAGATGASGSAAGAGAEIGALKTQLAALAKQVDALTAAAPIDLGPVTKRLDALEQARGDLATKIDVLTQRLNKLGDVAGRLDTLQKQVAALTDRSVDPRAAFVLAVGQLRDAVLAGRPFGKALDAAQRLAPKDDTAASALSALQPLAAGVESRSALLASFGEAANAAIDAEHAAAARGGGWLDKTLASIESLVRIRHLDGSAQGTGAEAVVSRAQAKLKQGDLAGAVAELKGLSPSAAPAMASWLKAARARLAAEQAVDSLTQRAIALISGAKG